MRKNRIKKMVWVAGGLLGLILLLVLLMVIFPVQILTSFGNYLVLEDELKESKIIVVLQGSPDRIKEAVDLYHEGWGIKIVMVNNILTKNMEELRLSAGVEKSKDIAIDRGVNEGDIIILPGEADSTFTEALGVKKYVEDNKIAKIIVVTSKYHTRRSKLTFSMSMPGVEVIIIPTKYDKFAPEDWWEIQLHKRYVINEYMKLVNFFLVDRWKLYFL